jgi:DNA-directed RNA polymerase subunit beta
MSYAVKNNQIQEVGDDEFDVELDNPNTFFGSHINLIPLHSAVQGPRLFYGARFYNQALPLANPEAPLVQNLVNNDPDGRSFDQHFGRQAGAVFTDDDEADVEDMNDDSITLRLKDGTTKVVDLYNRFPYNRKTMIHNTAKVKKGDHVTRGQLLAKSNYTDDEGTLAMGVNAKVGLVPYKGWSLDDAVVVSEAFAERLKSEHAYTEEMDYDRDTKGGLHHFISLFPDKYTKKQRETLDKGGVVQAGTILEQGDPMILATRPKAISSSSAQLGKLSKITRSARSDASLIWDHEEPGEVLDVAHTKNGVKVVTRSYSPARKGDKIVFRSGQKGVISKIMPNEHMPRTVAGEPLEVLLNPLGIPSRVNNSMVYELVLGKIAKKLGHPVKLSSFNKPGEAWYDQIMKMMEEAGVSDVEEVFDPESGKQLENPVTVGDAYILKLHHTAASKSSARGQGSYDSDRQPSQGGSDSAGAKRFSGLEIHSMLSAGAYNTLREGATLRGEQNDEYWRQLRMGYKPRDPGEPFVWQKFQALLGGAGMKVQDLGGGKMRLRPMTDKDLDSEKPIEVKDGRSVNLSTLEPFPGGLFDHALVGSNKWGRIPLSEPVPNPAFESQIRQLLGLTEKEIRAILAGESELPDHLR